MSDNFIDKKKKELSYFKDRANRSFKYMALKYHSTRFAQNVESLERFRKVYYHLIENDLPILKGGERKKKAQRAENMKNAILVSFMVFFCTFNRIGVINRIMLCLISS